MCVYWLVQNGSPMTVFLIAAIDSNKHNLLDTGKQVKNSYAEL